MVKRKSLPVKSSALIVESPCKKTPTDGLKRQASDFDMFEELQKVLRLRISQVHKPPVISGYEKEKK